MTLAPAQPIPITPPRNGGIVPPWLQSPVTLPVLPTPTEPLPPVVLTGKVES